SGVQNGDVVLQLAEPQLGARQVAEDADLPARLLARGPDPPHVLGVLPGSAVGEVEPEDVDPGVQELAQHRWLPARWPGGGDDLRATPGGGHQLCPDGCVLGTGLGAAGSWAVTGPVGASSGGGGLSSSCSITGSRQTTLASTRPAAADSSATKS